MTKTIAVFLTIFATVLAMPAQADDAVKVTSTVDFSRGFSDANAIDVREFTGRIEIAVGGNETAVILTQGKKAYGVDFILAGNKLIIEGEQRPSNFQLFKYLKKNGYGYGKGAIEKYLMAFPVLKISVPVGVDIVFDDVITTAMGGDTMGHFEINKGYVDALIGDVKSAKIGISSAGNVSLGDVSEALKVGIGGSGNFDAVSAGSATFSIGGSGDVQIGYIDNDVKMTIGGSGDIKAGDVGGVVRVNEGGSGEIEIGKAGAGADLSIAGSGDIAMSSINGPTKARIAGNGHIVIKDGLAKDLTVSISGNGDFDFDGKSTNLNVSIVGSGSVDVRKNTGSLKTSNRGGNIRVNGKSIKKKKHGG